MKLNRETNVGEIIQKSVRSNSDLVLIVLRRWVGKVSCEGVRIGGLNCGTYCKRGPWLAGCLDALRVHSTRSERNIIHAEPNSNENNA